MTDGRMMIAPGEPGAERRTAGAVQPLATVELATEAGGQLDVADQRPDDRRGRTDDQVRLGGRAVAVAKLRLIWHWSSPTVTLTA